MRLLDYYMGSHIVETDIQLYLISIALKYEAEYLNIDSNRYRELLSHRQNPLNSYWVGGSLGPG